MPSRSSKPPMKGRSSHGPASRSESEKEIFEVMQQLGDTHYDASPSPDSSTQVDLYIADILYKLSQEVLPVLTNKSNEITKNIKAREEARNIIKEQSIKLQLLQKQSIKLQLSHAINGGKTDFDLSDYTPEMKKFAVLYLYSQVEKPGRNVELTCTIEKTTKEEKGRKVEEILKLKISNSDLVSARDKIIKKFYKERFETSRKEIKHPKTFEEEARGIESFEEEMKQLKKNEVGNEKKVLESLVGANPAGISALEKLDKDFVLIEKAVLMSLDVINIAMQAEIIDPRLKSPEISAKELEKRGLSPEQVSKGDFERVEDELFLQTEKSSAELSDRSYFPMLRLWMGELQRKQWHSAKKIKYEEKVTKAIEELPVHARVLPYNYKAGVGEGPPPEFVRRLLIAEAKFRPPRDPKKEKSQVSEERYEELASNFRNFHMGFNEFIKSTSAEVYAQSAEVDLEKYKKTYDQLHGLREKLDEMEKSVGTLGQDKSKKKEFKIMQGWVNKYTDLNKDMLKLLEESCKEIDFTLKEQQKLRENLLETLKSNCKTNLKGHKTSKPESTVKEFEKKQNDLIMQARKYLKDLEKEFNENVKPHARHPSEYDGVLKKLNGLMMFFDADVEKQVRAFKDESKTRVDEFNFKVMVKQSEVRAGKLVRDFKMNQRVAAKKAISDKTKKEMQQLADLLQPSVLNASDNKVDRFAAKLQAKKKHAKLMGAIIKDMKKVITNMDGKTNELVKGLNDINVPLENDKYDNLKKILASDFKGYEQAYTEGSKQIEAFSNEIINPLKIVMDEIIKSSRADTLEEMDARNMSLILEETSESIRDYSEDGRNPELQDIVEQLERFVKLSDDLKRKLNLGVEGKASAPVPVVPQYQSLPRVPEGKHYVELPAEPNDSDEESATRMSRLANFFKNIPSAVGRFFSTIAFGIAGGFLAAVYWVGRGLSSAATGIRGVFSRSTVSTENEEQEQASARSSASTSSEDEEPEEALAENAAVETNEKSVLFRIRNVFTRSAAAKDDEQLAEPSERSSVSKSGDEAKIDPPQYEILPLSPKDKSGHYKKLASKDKDQYGWASPDSQRMRGPKSSGGDDYNDMPSSPEGSNKTSAGKGPLGRKLPPAPSQYKESASIREEKEGDEAGKNAANASRSRATVYGNLAAKPQRDVTEESTAEVKRKSMAEAARKHSLFGGRGESVEEEKEEETADEDKVKKSGPQ